MKYVYKSEMKISMESTPKQALCLSGVENTSNSNVNGATVGIFPGIVYTVSDL